MARKSLKGIDPKLTIAIEEFQSLSVIKMEMSQDAYDVQDDETKAAIDRVVATLRQHATGFVYLSVGGVRQSVKVDDQTLGYNLFWLAVEIVKDLGFVGLRVANWSFPDNMCVGCGDEVKPKGKRR